MRSNTENAELLNNKLTFGEILRTKSTLGQKLNDLNLIFKISTNKKQ